MEKKSMGKGRRFKLWFIRHITLHTYDDKQAELANGLTHLFGACMSLVALAAIIIKAAPSGNIGMTVAGAIFGVTMLLLYVSSSMYHLNEGQVAKRVLRILDHSNIYFLIAGTYTPVMVFVNTTGSMVILVLVWALTLVGITVTLLFWGKYGFLHVMSYIAMGWMVLFVWDDLVGRIPAEFLYWAVAGGITYTTGTIFYGMKKLPYYHAIWHMFVVGGSASFFIGIYQHLL